MDPTPQAAPSLGGGELRIHPDAGIGRVCLTARNLEALAAFYRERLGLAELERRDGGVRLGVGETALLEIEGEPAAASATRTAGLFHVAFRVPDRSVLARTVRHLIDSGSPPEGFADHLVSEAAYLQDPEGNGIEVYCDRPRATWFREGSLRMATLPLNVPELLSGLPAPGGGVFRLPRETVVGHIHLRVSDLAATESFYTGVLGFQLMMHFGSEAGFVSAGGYHHHVGYNTWGGPFGLRPADILAGLRYFTIRLPDQGELKRMRQALRRSAAAAADQQGDRLAVRDPSGIQVILEAG
jgi:catechol 2,3-dioxygenase